MLDRAAGRPDARPVPAPQPGTPAVRTAVRATTPPAAPLRPAAPEPRRPQEPSGPGTDARWRLPSVASSIPALRRGLRAWLAAAGVGEDHAYDLLLAACEAATNAIEHAQEPTEPYVDVTAAISGGRVRITVRDHGQWRERVPSMDRGRGSTLMSAVGEVTAIPGPEGTTVVIASRRSGPVG
ncbi:ATP-binding protein [Blastococcus tunisiensis]|uniref:ATP-binding protein n=1 Tax=Blastococcus tunisiensis TaxID=1798228 RepID=UPI0020C8DFFF|nr:ATP-binding protein [Blastococcus sp. DSM 46838]